MSIELPYRFQMYIPTRLQGVVSMIWEHEMFYSQNHNSEVIFPSGCHGLLFRLKGGVRISQNNRVERDFGSEVKFGVLCGLQTDSLLMRFETYHFLGVQLQPAALYSLFGLPATELTDTALESSLVLKELHLVEERLHELGSFQERARYIESWLGRCLLESSDLKLAIKMEQVLKRKSLHDPVGQLPFEQLLGYSRRQTHRLFKKWFGLSPGVYWRYKKFLNSLDRIHFDDQASLTEIAHSTGFYDQAHFTRTFKEFSGYLPKVYQKEKSIIPGHIIK